MGAEASNVKKVSFFSKDVSTCPICMTDHQKEELLSGGGRLIAGKLTNELRRLYQESKKYGTIYPLAYQVQVCPKCLFSAYPRDFAKVAKEDSEALKKTIEHRSTLVKTLFGPVDFKEPRMLVHGAASYILAIDCYHLRSSSVAPTMKKAVSCMRAAWLLSDLFAQASYRPYDQVMDFYYMEAVKNYLKTLEIMQTGAEPVEAESYILGPDLEKNWGYDGVIYLNSYLTRKYLDRMATTPKEKKETLERSKRYLSKLYGSGKSSKNKPSAIVDMAKDLYDEMGDLIKQFETQI
ncbi:MAG: DUF2225 domain-containing protein [Leptospirales bacterium]